jgi:hypothetical protein
VLRFASSSQGAHRPMLRACPTPFLPTWRTTQTLLFRVIHLEVS